MYKVTLKLLERRIIISALVLLLLFLAWIFVGNNAVDYNSQRIFISIYSFILFILSYVDISQLFYFESKFSKLSSSLIPFYFTLPVKRKNIVYSLLGTVFVNTILSFGLLYISVLSLKLLGYFENVELLSLLFQLSFVLVFLSVIGIMHPLSTIVIKNPVGKRYFDLFVYLSILFLFQIELKLFISDEKNYRIQSLLEVFYTNNLFAIGFLIFGISLFAIQVFLVSRLIYKLEI